MLVKPALNYLPCGRGTAVEAMYTPGTWEFLDSGAMNMWDVLECDPANGLGLSYLPAGTSSVAVLCLATWWGRSLLKHLTLYSSLRTPVSFSLPFSGLPGFHS